VMKCVWCVTVSSLFVSIDGCMPLLKCYGCYSLVCSVCLCFFFKSKEYVCIVYELKIYFYTFLPFAAGAAESTPVP
jgi:hypothetical protein